MFIIYVHVCVIYAVFLFTLITASPTIKVPCKLPYFFNIQLMQIRSAGAGPFWYGRFNYLDYYCLKFPSHLCFLSIEN